jgi:hypothetical protein
MKEDLSEVIADLAKASVSKGVLILGNAVKETNSSSPSL